MFCVCGGLSPSPWQPAFICPVGCSTGETWCLNSLMIGCSLLVPFPLLPNSTACIKKKSLGNNVSVVKDNCLYQGDYCIFWAALVYLFVCLFACQQHNSKSKGRILWLSIVACYVFAEEKKMLISAVIQCLIWVRMSVQAVLKRKVLQKVDPSLMKDCSISQLY